MTTLEQLIAARKLIEKPENWYQGAFRKGDAICAFQALRGVCSDPYDVLLGRLCDAAGVRSLALWNDTHTHTEVLDAFTKAIEMERMRVDAEGIA